MSLIRNFIAETSVFRLRLIGVYGMLAVANLFTWAWAILLFHDRPAMLGTALLAYGLGLRHAMDADHIAAINNVVRKLMQSGNRPVAVGFFFALGHSTVVLIAAVVGTRSPKVLAAPAARPVSTGARAPSEPQSLSASFDQANSARRSGDHRRAAELYRALVARYPNTAEARGPSSRSAGCSSTTATLWARFDRSTAT